MDPCHYGMARPQRMEKMDSVKTAASEIAKNKLDISYCMR